MRKSIVTLNTVAITRHVPAASLPRPGAVLELLKPVTWFPPIWAFGCGVVSSGFAGEHWRPVLTGLIVAGPLVCAASQAANDWFDREVDALNEPGRPIPSGRVPGRWGLGIAVLWTILSLAVGATLGWVGFGATAAGLVLAWAYSAPPVRLKQNGWIGNAAVGISYEGLAWVTGAAVGAPDRFPGGLVILVAALYSLGAHGIMTLNDFKSAEGDRRVGIRSLPVTLGWTRAGWVACVVMLVPQLGVVGLLGSRGSWAAAALLMLLVAVQVPLMARLLESPRERAPWYNGTGVVLYVLGMMLAAIAIRPGGGT